MKRKIFTDIEDALKDIKAGKLIIIVDSPDRENEGDLFCAASKITADKINFMAAFGRGLICIPMKSERLDELGISDMIKDNREKLRCAFSISVDYRNGTTTGISAFDRALTVQKLADKKSKAFDFLRPGHIFPLRAKNGGVLERQGHTEAAVDLSKLAGLYPAGVICEIMRDDGKMAKMPDLIKFAKRHNLKIISVESLVEYRKKNENIVKEIVRADLPTLYGSFKIALFEDIFGGESHIALIKGDVKGKENVLTRLHSACETGDIFHSVRCDCGRQLEIAMKEIEKAGRGIILYLPQEGRGIGLANKLKAYNLQSGGLDTVDANLKLGFAADLRDYAAGACILRLLQVKSVVLMTNNPKKIEGLAKYNVKVSNRTQIEIDPVKSNEKYLKTKKYRMGHILEKV